MRFATWVMGIFLVLSLGQAYAVVSVIDVQYLDDLKTCCTDTANDINANVRQYSSTVTSGGGQFVARSGPGGSECADSTDEGVIIKETAGSKRCWYRQFSGPVHLKWYGVTSATDSGAPDVTTQLKSALAIAAAAIPGGSSSGASRVVDTDGMRIHASDDGVGHAVDIPPDVRLTCDATPGGNRKVGTDPASVPDYTNTPATIVLTQNLSSLVLPIALSDNSELDHCIVLTTGIGNNILLHPTTISDGMQDVRNMILNASTAVICDNATSCNIHDNLIIGFDTAIEVSSSSHTTLNDNTIDAEVGIFLTDLGSPAIINGFEMDSFLGHGNAFTPDAYTAGSVIPNPSGGCRIKTISNNGGINDFDQGDPVDITGITYPLNCNGFYYISNVSRGVNYIDLAGSTFAAPSTTGSWLAGSQVISVASTVGIWSGETVSCTGTCTGFPSTTPTVVSISQYKALSSGATYKVVISQPTTASGGTGATLKFNSSGSASGASVYLNATLRPWTAHLGPDGMHGTYKPDGAPYDNFSLYHINGTGTCIQGGTDADGASASLGIKIVNASCFGHEVSYAFAGAGPGGCIDCTSDNHANIEDLGQIALLIRGTKTGYLNFSGMAQAATGGVVIDLPLSDHCVGLSNSQFDTNTSGVLGFHAVNGCFTLNGVRTNSSAAQGADWLLDIGPQTPVNGTVTGVNSQKRRFTLRIQVFAMHRRVQTISFKLRHVQIRFRRISRPPPA